MIEDLSNVRISSESFSLVGNAAHQTKTLCLAPMLAYRDQWNKMRRRRSVSGYEAVGRIIATLVGPPSRETIQALETLSSRPRGPKAMSNGNLEKIPKNGSHYCCEPGKKSPDSIRSKQ